MSTSKQFLYLYLLLIHANKLVFSDLYLKHLNIKKHYIYLFFKMIWTIQGFWNTSCVTIYHYKY